MAMGLQLAMLSNLQPAMQSNLHQVTVHLPDMVSNLSLRLAMVLHHLATLPMATNSSRLATVLHLLVTVAPIHMEVPHLQATVEAHLRLMVATMVVIIQLHRDMAMLLQSVGSLLRILVTMDLLVIMLVGPRQLQITARIHHRLLV